MAKIELLTDPKAFLEVLDKSGLIAPGEVAEIRRAAADQADATSLARALVKEGKLTSWQAGQLLARFSRLTIGKYRLLNQLGKGPMGRVYLAEHGQLNKKVSLKVLPARFSSQPEVLQRFLAEAKGASALNHRNIIHIYDVGQDDEGRYYLAMEYVEGKDVQRLVEADGPLPLARAIDLLRQTADGLAHAHEQGLTHGDLKPSNLIVDSSGVVKILDFGLSELADNSTAAASIEESTEAPSLVGLACRAPELLSGKQRSDVRSDLYSLGAIAHYLLTGKPPSRDEGTAPAAALDAVPGMLPELANLCDHLLAAKPQDRPESAAQVVAALGLAERALPAALPEKAPTKKESDRPAAGARAKRPLVAKPLEVAASPDDASDEPDAPQPATDDPMSAFAIKTGKKRRSMPVPSAAVTTTPASAAAPTSRGAKRRWPVVPIALIGGGVVVLGVMVAVVLVLLNRGGGSQSVAKAAKPNAAAAAKDDQANESGESNPEANPEANPPAEASDAKAAPPAQAVDQEKSPEASVPSKGGAPSETKETSKAPPEGAPAASSSTTPAPTGTAPPPTPPADTKQPPPAGETKTEPTKTEPAKTTPPPPSAGNPFEGFASAVALPALEVMGKPAPDALAPAALGPIKIDPSALCIVQLKGGEAAFKGKYKLLLESAEQGTAPRDWEFKAQSDKEAPVVIATMSLKEDQLTFQWTEQARENQAAPYLCNCVLSMSAGTGTHQVALRKPLVVDALPAQVEKGAFNESWNLEYPPTGKQVTVEVGPLEGGPPKHKIDPKTELEAFKDSTYLFAGNTDDALILGFKIDVSMPARSLQIVAQPQYFFSGAMARPDRYLKSTPATLAERVAGGLRQANVKVAVAKQFKDAGKKKKAEDLANSELNQAQKGAAQVEQLQEVAKSLQETGKIHFRAYYMADDVKVELITTGTAPTAPAPMAAKK